jgi:hypothetical protein
MLISNCLQKFISVSQKVWPVDMAKANYDYKVKKHIWNVLP